MFKIVSLCPSSTLTIIELGLKENLVGRTKFCIKPEQAVDSIFKVGGTKDPNFEKIKKLNPSHILFNLEENNYEHESELKTIAPLVTTTPTDINSTIEMLNLYGGTFNSLDKSSTIIANINNELINLKCRSFKPFSYLYLIWQKPFMVAGKNTYIDSMLSLVNGKNAAKNLKQNRYFEISESDILKLNLDVLFLSSEPFPFKTKHLEIYQHLAKEVKLIDGEALSWHGAFTVFGLTYLQKYFK
jgi:iron complex transport system substrate-binding protein